MVMRTKFLLVSLTFFLIALSASSFAYDVVVFEDYDTSYFLKEGKLSVEKRIRLKNIGKNPIIPGELHFRVYEARGEKSYPVEVENLAASNNNNDLSTRVTKYKEYSDIIVHVWNPVLPEFELPITISYDLDFAPKGVFFHEVQFPIEETTIPIRDSSVNFMLPKKYHVTYATTTEINEDGIYNIVRWINDDDLSLEYTLLPLPRTPFRMVSVFWLSILVVLGVIFIFLNSRRKD